MFTEIIKFLLVGGIAATANFLSGFFFRTGFGIVGYNYQISLALGFTVGTIISFILNRSLTFKAHRGNIRAQAFRFVLAAVVAIFLSVAVGLVIIKLIASFSNGTLSEDMVVSISHITTILLMTLYSYIAIKYFAFRS